jgi:hypothetical protein
MVEYRIVWKVLNVGPNVQEAFGRATGETAAEGVVLQDWIGHA